MPFTQQLFKLLEHYVDMKTAEERMTEDSLSEDPASSLTQVKVYDKE